MSVNTVGGIAILVSMTSAYLSLCIVLLDRAQPQVLRIDATRSVARMTDEHAVVEWPLVNQVRKPMRPERLHASDDAISIAVYAAMPQPATDICWSGMTPEPFNDIVPQPLLTRL